MHAYPELPSAEFCKGTRRSLLRWFRKARRDLPWRRDRDPYHIWVSEVMLQQTQVATVIPYYRRFLAAFPDLNALASADEQAVLQQWEGLGYYRRARDLHRAVRQVVQNYHGQVPNDPQAFRSLPGVGRYMTGAVLSQAFDCRLPILEANSLRVLSRLFACRTDPRGGTVNDWLWTAAERLLPQKHAGDFNQAMMELGALVCTSRQPSCGSCPLTKFCAACAHGLQEQVPVPPKQPAKTSVEEVAVVIRRRSKVLIAQRPSAGRWAGLWEFPHAPLRGRESRIAAAARVSHELTSLSVRPRKVLTLLEHGVTRFRIKMACLEAEYEGGHFSSSFYLRGKWVAISQFTDYPLSSPQRRLASLLAGLDTCRKT